MDKRILFPRRLSPGSSKIVLSVEQNVPLIHPTADLNHRIREFRSLIFGRAPFAKPHHHMYAHAMIRGSVESAENGKRH